MIRVSRSPLHARHVLSSLLGQSLGLFSKTILFSCFILGSSGQFCNAQPVTPAIDGTGTIVTPNGNQFEVTGGTASRDGNNLFHSFQQFGLDPNQAVTFFANSTIQNIFGRVVGGNPSIINGLLQITGGNPNLFLVNPAGIIFGNSATLNVPASFAATTATSIGFGSQWFDATSANSYDDLIGDPTSFAFGVAQPGSIINAGNLAVPQGQNLTLLGGTVVNTGSLSAPGGHITVSAVPGENLVRLSQPGSLLSLELVPFTPSSAPTISPPSLPQLLTGGNLSNATGLSINSAGQVELTSSQTSILSTIGSTTIAGQLDSSGQTGGLVQVLGNQVNVVGGDIKAAGIANGGTVLIGGDYKGQGSIPNASQSYVSNNSIINADSTSSGNGGRAIVWANGATEFYGTITARGGTQSGNGGFAEVSGKQTLVFDGSVDLTAANGSGGTLLLDPTDIIISNGSTPGTSLLQNTLEMMPGNMDLVFEATNNIVIGNLDVRNLDRTGAIRNRNALQLQNAPTFGMGTAGAVIFRSDADNDGVGSFLMTEFAPNGERQALQATGRNITILGTTIITGDIETDFSDGNAGNISLSARNNIATGYLRGVHASGNPGVGGTVSVNAGGNFTLTGSVASFSTQGGSNISIQAQGNITLNCTISTGACVESFAGGLENFTPTGGSGNIQIISQQGDISILKSDPNIGTPVINAGNGAVDPTGNAGNVTLKANGNITVGNIGATSSFNSGQINIFSNQGNIIVNDIIVGSSGNAGNIQLESQGGSITSSGTLDTGSSGGNTGIISLNAQGDILVNNAFSYALGVGSDRGSTLSLSSSSGDVTATGSLNASSVNSKGGAIALSGNNITLNGQVTLGSEAGLGGDPLIFNASGRVSLPAIVETNGADIQGIQPIGALSGSPAGSTIRTEGGNVNLSFQADGTLNAASSIVTSGGDITFKSPGNLAIAGLLNTASTTGAGGDIRLESGESIQTGDLLASGTSGGNVTVIARTQITTGVIDTSGTIGNGGNVLLDPLGDIQVTSINAQGGVVGRGGNVDIETQRFFRATGGFSDRNNLFASISTAGGIGGGDITIRHGGRGITPFTIGDPSVNGTAGLLTTGADNIIALGNQYYFTYTQPGLSGTIRIISIDPTSPPEAEPTRPLPDESRSVCSLRLDEVCLLEEYFTRQYDRYFGFAQETPIKSLDQIQQELRDIEQATGVKPALIYAYFMPRNKRAQLTPEGLDFRKEQLAQAAKQTVAIPPALEGRTVSKASFPIGCDLVQEENIGQPPYDIQVPTQGQESCQLHLLLVTAKETKPFLPQNAPRSDVLLSVKALSERVNKQDNIGRDFKPAARQLYDWLVMPQLNMELQRQGISNLVYIMDVGLRSVPLAALYDEESGQYLIEQYSLGLMPSMSQTEAIYNDVRQVKALLMGAENFPPGSYFADAPLRSVPIELGQISQLWQTRPILNSAFTLEKLRSSRALTDSGLVHLATHARFTPDNSFIQLGQGELRFDQIRNLNWYNPSVELLVLSACTTAFSGDNAQSLTFEELEKTELGFTGLAIRNGVKSGIGSLWLVNDLATSALMIEFHRWLQEPLYQEVRPIRIKAAALQQAQISLLKKQIVVEGGQLRSAIANLSIDLPPSLQTTADLSHPYFWAGFTMVGNPW